jgi:hypothetical protein
MSNSVTNERAHVCDNHSCIYIYIYIHTNNEETYQSMEQIRTENETSIEYEVILVFYMLVLGKILKV